MHDLSPYLFIDHVGDRSAMRGDEGCYLGFLFERQGTVELQSKGLPREASSNIRHSCLELAKTGQGCMVLSPEKSSWWEEGDASPFLT